MSNIKETIKAEFERRKKICEGIFERDSDTYYQGKAVAYEEALAFIDPLPGESENHGCGVEFPHFGPNYPDAKCIDGYLWDMDSYEDGVYTIGGDDPCPICNTEKWLKDVLDDEIFETRDEALEYVKMLKSKYKHKNSLPDEESSKDLEEELDRFIASGKSITVENCGTYKVSYHDFMKVARHFAEWGAKHLK